MEPLDIKIPRELFQAWDRNNSVLLNLLSALPNGGLEAKATASSPTVSQMFMHIHHERLVSVAEEAPENDPKVPRIEWLHETDSEQISKCLKESARVVQCAVEARIKNGKALELHFGHPSHLIHFLIFHEGYHHGQIKLALKVAGKPMDDSIVGPLTWDVWRRVD